MCDKRSMTEHHPIYDEDAAVNWLRRVMAETKTPQRALGEAWGISGEDPGNYVGKTLSGKRKLKLREFLISKDFFGEPIDTPPIPLMGKVGAGGHVYGMSDDPIDYLEGIKGYPRGTMAVEVDGDSMGHFIPDGSILLYDTIYEAPLQEHINQICILWRADGKTVVKKLLRGSRKDRWSLLSLTGGDVEEDVFLDYVARVTGVRFR